MAIWKRPKSSKKGREASTPVAAKPGRPRPEVTERPFCLGKTTMFRGELAGKTDVEIEGIVEGTIDVGEYALVVAASGRVTAGISARTVLVRGQVAGDVYATEQITIEASGSVLGDICAPSISLADGSRFTGSINRSAPPAKVTGELGGGPTVVDVKAQGDRPAAPQRKRSLADRRGQDRPWSEAPKGRCSRRSPEPSPSA